MPSFVIVRNRSAIQSPSRSINALELGIEMASAVSRSMQSGSSTEVSTKSVNGLNSKVEAVLEVPRATWIPSAD